MNSSLDSRRFDLYCEEHHLETSIVNRGLWLAGRQSYADDAVEALARQLLASANEVGNSNLSNVNIAERKLASGNFPSTRVPYRWHPSIVRVCSSACQGRK